MQGYMDSGLTLVCILCTGEDCLSKLRKKTETSLRTESTKQCQVTVRKWIGQRSSKGKLTQRRYGLGRLAQTQQRERGTVSTMDSMPIVSQHHSTSAATWLQCALACYLILGSVGFVYTGMGSSQKELKGIGKNKFLWSNKIHSNLVLLIHGTYIPDFLQIALSILKFQFKYTQRLFIF